MTGESARPQQRLGRIVERRPFGSGSVGRTGVYVVRDVDTGDDYTFMYADIVTEGFRTIRTGERVRFITDPERPGEATYIVRLDLPEVEAYYR
ncbi:hypothetical protein GCM10027176_30290 [Actinoallomurus bryophytorum]|uniref:Cold shock CspA family protein n=1 Tax=Actinoallomurus bryophytorum TaxID=1490222 RepID=A0A543CG86_9ACTN|nr:hypothetical protein [Actinoallomurus bryophytorum]TQL96113.1 hypothetical protein FB559_1633 [Actinoallomurus bryophytorum]